MAIVLTMLVSPVTESGLGLLVIEFAAAVIVTDPALLPVATPPDVIVAVPLPVITFHVNVGYGEIVLPYVS
jgi:hypothetical protein